MAFYQEFLIAQQPQNQRIYNEYYISNYVKQPKPECLVPFKTSEIISLQDNQEQYGSKRQLLLQQKRDKFKSNAQKAKEIVQNLIQKLTQNFTEYIKKCQQLFENVGFEGQAVKRSRKIQADGQELLFHYITISQLFTSEQIKKFMNYIQQSQILKAVLADLLAFVSRQYRDEIIYTTFRILSQLHKEMPEKQKQKEAAQHMLNSLFPVMKAENKLSKLIFAEVILLTKAQDLNDSIHKYCCELINSWVSIFRDITNYSLHKYEGDIDQLDSQGISNTKNERFFFQFEQEQQQFGILPGAPRKIKHH